MNYDIALLIMKKCNVELIRTGYLNKLAEHFFYVEILETAFYLKHNLPNRRNLRYFCIVEIL